MDIAIMSNQVRHYTGGRYLGYMAAVALADRGNSVTVYSDRHVPFRGDFVGYRQPAIVVDRAVAGRVRRHDVFFGVPPFGGAMACQLAQRHKAGAAAYLFDVLPLMVESGRHDHGTLSSIYTGYMQWVRAVRARVVVLALCNRKPAATWLRIPEKRVDRVYPAVNLKAIGDDPTKVKREKRIVWVSRILPHKLFPHFLEAVKPFDVGVDVICSRADRALASRYGLGHVVKFHTNISDSEKFAILSRAKLLVFSSSFEGFGMAPLEAWACSTPVAMYRLPTLMEVAKPMKDVTYWAAVGDRWQLQGAVFRALSEDKAGRFEPDRRFGMDRLGKELETVLGRARR